MSLTVNMRELIRKDINLQGDLSVEELELNGLDEVIHANRALKYNFTVQKLEKSILLHGDLYIELDCECVRCLKPFVYTINLKDWSLMLQLEGEERVEIINDILDLVPILREDIILNFPQHPLCEPGCPGLPKKVFGAAENMVSNEAEPFSAVWSELDKIKLK